MEHYEFISRTDKKSLFNQIKFLVDCGKESYQNDLATRKTHLRELLEQEEQIYENEFAEKIESRVDENIRERQKSLLTMKQERLKEQEKFVASQKLHQKILNCLDIRDELRRKDYRETQLCQLEQMNEKSRANERLKKIEESWLKVQKRIEENADRTQKQEDNLKNSLQANQCRILENQVQEHRKALEMDLARARNEKIEFDLKMKTDQGNEKQKTLQARNAKSQDVIRSMNTICEQKELIKKEAGQFENIFHQETMRQVNKEIEDSKQTNFKFKQDTRDYLTYIKKFKNFVADQHKKQDERSDELERRFNCFKNQHKRTLAASKQQHAKTAQQTLLKQICEEQARRLKLEAAERENKMIENNFAKIEARDKLKECIQVRKDLDEQLELIDRLKKEKDQEFEREVYRNKEDKLNCDELLMKYKNEACDYLPPHPNWRLLNGYKDKDAQIMYEMLKEAE